jgi:hypothetical protein
VRPILWPQEFIRYGYPSNFKELPLALLVCGELEIMNLPGISEQERWARAELLIQTCYHSLSFDWSQVQTFHSNALFEYECGLRNWAGRESLLSLEAHTLYSRNPMQKGHVMQGAKFQNNASQSVRNFDNSRKPRTDVLAQAQAKGQKLYCKDYQVGKCTFSFAPHKVHVNNNTYDVNHFCSSCFRLTKRMNSHPANSPDCPSKR